MTGGINHRARKRSRVMRGKGVVETATKGRMDAKNKGANRVEHWKRKGKWDDVRGFSLQNVSADEAGSPHTDGELLVAEVAVRARPVAAKAVKHELFGHLAFDRALLVRHVAEHGGFLHASHLDIHRLDDVLLLHLPVRSALTPLLRLLHNVPAAARRR